MRISAAIVALTVVLVASQSAASEPIAIEQIMGYGGNGQAPLWDPVSIDSAYDGAVFVVGQESHNVFRIPRSGSAELIATAADGLDHPYRVAVGPEGNAYVNDSGGSTSLYRITPEGIVDLIDFGVGVGEIATDSAGNVYGASANSVLKRTPGGSLSELIDETGAGTGQSLQDVGGLAVDGSGNVYVTGSSSNNAFRITPAGSITQIIDQDGDLSGNELRGAWGIDVDPIGNVYVVGLASDNLFRIEPDGSITEVLDATGDGLGNTLELPMRVAVDAKGNAYVTGYFSDNVFHVAPDGTVSEIMDSTGDGLGNLLRHPQALTLGKDGAALYVVAYTSGDSVFRIRFRNTVPGLVPTGLLLFATVIVASGSWAARRR